MFEYPGFCFGIGWWWIFPIIMIVLCFFMARGRMGSMLCWRGSLGKNSHITHENQE